MLKSFWINIDMKQFQCLVRASGMVVQTMVMAKTSLEATKILQAQFGAANVLQVPQQVGR